MAERYLRALANGGLAFDEDADGTTPIFTAAVDPDNVAAATSHAQSDYVYMVVGGVLKKVLVSNLIPTSKVIVPIIVTGQVITAMVGVFGQSMAPFADRARKITGIYMVAGDKWGTTGSTTFRITEAGGEYADVTMAYGSLASARVSCALSLAANEAFTLATTAGGGHSGVVIYIEMEIY